MFGVEVCGWMWKSGSAYGCGVATEVAVSGRRRCNTDRTSATERKMGRNVYIPAGSHEHCRRHRGLPLLPNHNILRRECGPARQAPTERGVHVLLQTEVLGWVDEDEEPGGEKRIRAQAVQLAIGKPTHRRGARLVRRILGAESVSELYVAKVWRTGWTVG